MTFSDPDGQYLVSHDVLSSPAQLWGRL